MTASAAGGPAESGPVAGGPTEGGPTEGGPVEGGPTEGSPTEGSPTEGSPTAGGPTAGRGTYRLRVNGADHVVEADPETPLLLVLRNDLGLMGTRFGCGMGLCGACFVRVDGAVVPSCDTPVWSVRGKAVVTVEGLAGGDGMHRVQRAVLETQAAQCGYCVSGVLVSAAALLDREPHPDEPAVVAALERNLCRCGVQRRLVQAVVRAGRPDE